METILFSILILRMLQDSEGNIWHCHLKNLYVVEFTNKEVCGVMFDARVRAVIKIIYIHLLALFFQSNSIVSKDFLSLLPTSYCLTPKQCIEYYSTAGSSKMNGDNK